MADSSIRDGERETVKENRFSIIWGSGSPWLLGTAEEQKKSPLTRAFFIQPETD